MARRFASIWFRHLATDWVTRRRPDLRTVPFVLAAPERGRVVVKAANRPAQEKGANTGMVVADCRAILPALQVFDHMPGLAEKTLTGLAEWCLRFTPIAATQPPDGLMLDISGCAHLWGGERPYLKDMIGRLSGFGYDTRAAITDTVGSAWAVSRYSSTAAIIETGMHREALQALPPAALRLPSENIERLEKLGLSTIASFMDMPRAALRRRFGTVLIEMLDKALGALPEMLIPIRPVPPYQERLPSYELIRTRKGIEIALHKLLEALCQRLAVEDKGIRAATFKAHRADGNIQQIEIGTNRATRDIGHLLKLFGLKIDTMTPALGFELFLLEATIVEDIDVEMDQLWQLGKQEHEKDVAELLDRIAGKIGVSAIHRFLPAEHYWPERSIKRSTSLQEKPQTIWRTDRPRPVHLLSYPEPIEVMVQLPDYPPLHFTYKGKVHRVRNADGPERIEQEWWLERGEHRDYYCVEDETGGRYWLFRLGSYAGSNPKWFIHGFFA